MDPPGDLLLLAKDRERLHFERQLLLSVLDTDLEEEPAPPESIPSEVIDFSIRVSFRQFDDDC